MNRRLAWFALGIIAVLGIAATVTIETGNLYIQNSDGAEVKLRIRTAAAQTAPWLEFTETNALRFSLPATGIVPLVYGGTGTNTAAGVRSVIGIPEGATNSTPVLMRTYLQLVDAVVTNTVVPVLNGGTGSTSVGGIQEKIGLMAGDCYISSDGTVTNEFGRVYMSPPRVVALGASDTATNVYLVSVSITNCVFAGLTNDLINFIVFGAPSP
jgi:hypothetical protein